MPDLLLTHESEITDTVLTWESENFPCALRWNGTWLRAHYIRYRNWVILLHRTSSGRETGALIVPLSKYLFIELLLCSRRRTKVRYVKEREGQVTWVNDTLTLSHSSVVQAVLLSRRYAFHNSITQSIHAKCCIYGSKYLETRLSRKNCHSSRINSIRIQLFIVVSASAVLQHSVRLIL
jgi:hypothetical protein